MVHEGILVCPNNQGKDLRRIEDVERLIYAGPPKTMVSRIQRKKFLSRPIILVNPNLEAIHQQSNEKNKVRSCPAAALSTRGLASLTER